MRKPDEIMAEYLLKGGKMLAKTCQTCGSPLFEIKGDTFCVVCRETEPARKDEEKSDLNKRDQESGPGTDKPGKFKSQSNLHLDDQFDCTIKALLIRIEEEQDSRRLQDLTRAVKELADAYAIIHHGYDNRDNS